MGSIHNTFESLFLETLKQFKIPLIVELRAINKIKMKYFNKHGNDKKII